MSQGPGTRAFRAMASLLRVPLYCVPGNHGVYNPQETAGER
jgi:hypothetical protein